MKKRFSFRRWCDEWVLAAKGIVMATRNGKFWVGFFVSFLVFGTLMNMLAGGLGKFELMGALGFPEGLRILWSAMIGTIGIGMPFFEWLPVFLIAVLQGVLIGLIVVLWNKKRVATGRQRRERAENASDNAANVQRAGIITGLIALGAGCPTCGTTLLTPLLGAMFSTGSFAVAGVISSVVTAVAIIVALLSLKRLGEEMYVVIVNERYLQKKAERKKNEEVK